MAMAQGRQEVAVALLAEPEDGPPAITAEDGQGDLGAGGLPGFWLAALHCLCWAPGAPPQK